MPAPRFITVTLYNAETGDPWAGGPPTWAVYKDDASTAISTRPDIVNKGDGDFAFTPTFTVDRGIFWRLAAPAGAVFDEGGSFKGGYARPEDWYGDKLVIIKDVT